jgi:hypothetical protein
MNRSGYRIFQKAQFASPARPPTLFACVPEVPEPGKIQDLLARSEGFEPPTPRFEVWCSIQLSYERQGLSNEERA